MVDEDNMTYSERNPGYVSHSFAQYVAFGNGFLVILDHGDAYPRATQLQAFDVGRYGNAVGEGELVYPSFVSDIIEYSGPIGENYTGASAGGLACAADGFVTVGETVDQAHFEE